MRDEGKCETINLIRLTCGRCGKQKEFGGESESRSQGWQIEWRPQAHIFCPEHVTK